MPQATTIRAALRAYILTNFLEGEDPELLKDDSPLVSTGIINSLSLVKLAAFMTKEFKIRLKPNEMNAAHLDTIERMEKLISERAPAGS